MPKPKVKPFDIPKQMVWEAYRRVAANKGAPGVDGQALEEFESDLKNNLYKIWNRMSSGSYFPPPVRAVEIPKPHGGGSACSVYRRSQTGWPRRWWPCTWRAGGTAVPPRLLWLPAGQARPWTRSGYAGSGAGSTTGSIDLDVQKFFDTVPWDLVVKAVEAVTDCPLGAAVCEAVARCAAAAPRRHPCRAGQGNPAGIGGLADPGEPVHALCVRHVDGPELPGLPVRALCRRCCRALREQAAGRTVLAAITKRMEEVGLRLHPDKTRIVYCKDGKRRGEHEHTSFTFLGFTFRPREATTARTGSSSPRSCLRSAPRRSRPKAPAPRAADPPAHRPDPGRPGAMAEPHRRRVDELLRPVLPVGDVSPPPARQHLPEALGWEEVPAAADLQAVQAVVDRAARTRARPVRPLAVGPRVLRAGEKSPVTGDCHAGIRGSRGLRCPRPPDHCCASSATTP